MSNNNQKTLLCEILTNNFKTALEKTSLTVLKKCDNKALEKSPRTLVASAMS